MNKVLIIEDDLIVANIYKNKFAVEGFQVEIAQDGEAGLEMARNFVPDAVLLDLMLPKLPGVELLKALRAEERFKDLPIIVFSSTYLTSQVQQAWREGATKCLSKTNCTPKQVLEMVRACIQSEKAPAAAPQTGPATQPASPSQAAAAPKPTEEDAFQTDVRRKFLAGLPETLKTMRNALQGIVKAENEADRLKKLDELYRQVHAVTGNAAIAGTFAITQMSEVLESLLRELSEKPASINASTLRTVASAVDFLNILLTRNPSSLRELPPAKALVVDDEVLSRRAITYALDKAKIRSVSSDDPVRAFELLTHDRFNLIFLDVDMPNMSGHELCSKLRALPAYKQTPVVFVTGLNDFESRANSTMSGGNDFIGKPFLFIELAVKAVMHLLRSQLAAIKR